MTVKEFLENEKKLAIHCDTKEKAIKLLNIFNKLGKKWEDGDSYFLNCKWELYEENSCYTNCGCVKNKEWCNRAEVIEFNELEDFKFEAEVALAYLQGYLDSLRCNADKTTVDNFTIALATLRRNS